MYCSDKGPNQWLCILKAGHNGDHLSIDNTGFWKGSPGRPVHWPQRLDEPVRRSPPTSANAAYQEARQKGFEGIACHACGSLNMTRNGSCLKCHDCGDTTGCS